MTESELDPLAKLLKLANQASSQAIRTDADRSATHDSGQASEHETAGIELALEIEQAAARHLRNSVETPLRQAGCESFTSFG